MAGLQVGLDNLYMPYVWINYLFLNLSEALKSYSRTDIVTHLQVSWPIALVAYRVLKTTTFSTAGWDKYITSIQEFI